MCSFIPCSTYLFLVFQNTSRQHQSNMIIAHNLYKNTKYESSLQFGMGGSSSWSLHTIFISLFYSVATLLLVSSINLYQCSKLHSCFFYRQKDWQCTTCIISCGEVICWRQGRHTNEVISLEHGLIAVSFKLHTCILVNTTQKQVKSHASWMHCPPRYRQFKVSQTYLTS